jgi:RNA polymerase primary sigma factor
MAGMGNSHAFLKKGNLAQQERTDWSVYRTHPAFRLLSDEEFAQCFNAFDAAQFLFHGYERKLKKLVDQKLPVPKKLIEHLDRARLRKDRLREPLTLGNMKLVFKLAASFAGRGVDFSDLVQEAYFAICHALARFQIKRGFKFSTYASWWVRSVLRLIVLNESNLRILRVPVHRQEAEHRISREEASFETVYGARPSDEELLAYIKQRGSRIAGISLKKLRAIRAEPVIGRKISYDVPIGEEGGETMLSLLAAEVYSPETLAAARERLPELEKEITAIIEDDTAKKPWRDTQMMRWRFGIDNGKPRTLQQIGDYYKISRERVRQIVARRLKQHGLSERAFKAKLESLETIRVALQSVPR